MFALTFDDGPDPRGTPAVIDALAAVGACATFFMLGERAAAHPKLVSRVRAAGHVLGVHGHRHVRHAKAGRAAVVADLRSALQELRHHGVQPRRWRVPYGALAEFTPLVAAEHRLVLTGWTADTGDWRGVAPAAMLASVEPRLRPGAVILLHDGVGPGAERVNADATAEVIGRLVAVARLRGLEPVGLDRDWPAAVPPGSPIGRIAPALRLEAVRCRRSAND